MYKRLYMALLWRTCMNNAAIFIFTQEFRFFMEKYKDAKKR